MKRIVKLSRLKITKLVQAATGHGLFAAHLAHWRPCHKVCKLCDENDQTSAHLWAECPVLSRERMNLVEDQRPLNKERNIIDFFSNDRIVKTLLNNLGENSL